MDAHPLPSDEIGEADAPELISYEAPAIEAHDQVLGLLSKTPSGNIVPP